MAHRGLIEPFGIPFVVEADDERFVAAARFALDRYPTTGSLHRTSVELRCRTLPPGPPAVWPVTRMDETPSGLTLRSGRSEVSVTRSAAHTIAELALEPDLLTEPHATRVFVEAAFWSATIGGGIIHAVHSGLVVRGSVGVLLRGQSGAGKSTLTYACVRRGMSISSDDWVYALADAPRVELHGYPWLMWLTTDAAARFSETALLAAVAHPGSDRVKVPVTPPEDRRHVSVEPSAIVFVEPSDAVRLDPIDAAESAARFAVSALDSERDGLPKAFVARLLDRPAFVLGRGASPDDAAAAIDHLAERLASRT